MTLLTSKRFFTIDQNCLFPLLALLLAAFSSIVEWKQIGLEFWFNNTNPNNQIAFSSKFTFSFQLLHSFFSSVVHRNIPSTDRRSHSPSHNIIFCHGQTHPFHRSSTRSPLNMYFHAATFVLFSAALSVAKGFAPGKQPFAAVLPRSSVRCVQHTKLCGAFFLSFFLSLIRPVFPRSFLPPFYLWTLKQQERHRHSRRRKEGRKCSASKYRMGFPYCSGM